MSSSIRSRSPSVITLYSGPFLLRAGRRLLEWGVAVSAWWRESRRRSRDRTVLASMSPRELNDIGIGRGEVLRVVSEASRSRWCD